ncbi:MAG: nicotinate-nucleotide--dimethylbenzimidazole phosphoribosyltransferase [Sphaerochaeta sp.]|jgi:nicotinate-nucleotide--dimethylbenzimidazole phosphoribosyltransferase
MPIPPIDETKRTLFGERLLQKAILPHSLGELGELAIKLALIKEGPLGRPIHLLFGADHGVVAEGVTHSPQEITWQQCRSFALGGGACSLFARLNGVEQRIIDVGIAHQFAPEDRVIDMKVGWGSANLLKEPAMTKEECEQAMDVGRLLVGQASDEGFDLVIFGEMGVGNSTSASAIAAAMLAVDPHLVTGRGSGLSEKELDHKVAVVQKALQTHPSRDPLEILRCLGGFEVAAIVGGIMEGVRRGLPILIDGIVVTAAALIAHAMEPRIVDFLICAHRSASTGHALMVEHLGCGRALLDLGMYLGEGTGALAAWPLVRLASNILTELESFDEAQVYDSTTLLRTRGLV